MECANILRSSSTEVSLSLIDASVKNGGRRTALRGVQYTCFLELTSFLSAAQRSTSAIGKQMLSPSTVKEMLTSIETTEGEWSDSAKENAAIDFPKDFPLKDACVNVSCTSPSKMLLVSMVRLEKSPSTFLYFSLTSSLVSKKHKAV